MKCITMRTTFFFARSLGGNEGSMEKKPLQCVHVYILQVKYTCSFPNNLWMFVAVIFCFCNVLKVRIGSTILFYKLSEVNLGRVATKRKYFWGSKIIFWKFELIAYRMKQHPVSFNLQIHSIWDERKA